MAWLLWMKHPRYNLTWRAIRRRWAPSKEQMSNANGNGIIGNHHSKSHSIPLLHNNTESIPNNTMNIFRHSCPSIDEHEKLRSDSVLDLTVIPLSSIRSSNYYENLSKVSQLGNMEFICSELRTIILHLSTLTRHAQREEEHDIVSQDWKFVAMVVDRLCLILFTTAMALFTGLTLFSTPNFFKLK